MFGGGEEYFAEPESIDKDTLYRYAEFCTKLRSAEKAGKKTIESLCDMAANVGNNMTAKEMVVGVVLRAIKGWKGDKQWLYWCLLDKLCKEHPETFGFLAGKHILEIGTECIPWEDERPEKPRYQGLVEHWDGVFPKEVIQTIWNSRKERLYNTKHPEEARQALKDEEEVWKKEEQRHMEEEGLDDFAEPCLAYLQGNCSWGRNCPQLHPDGLEGTLPPECRSGDWRCDACGTINRHFRRRCFTCPKEKPQYRRGRDKTDEEKLLSNPDTKALAIFSRQFGYDPADERTAVQYWNNVFSTTGDGITLEQWRAERSASYRTRILAKAPTNDLEVIAATRTHWESSTDPEWQQIVQDSIAAAEELRPTKKRPLELRVSLPSVPPMPARDRVYYTAHRVLDHGVQHSDTPGYLYLLCQALGEAASDPAFKTPPTPEAPLALVQCTKLVFTAWSTSGKPKGHPAVPFCQDLQRYVSILPLQPSQRQEIQQYCDIVLKA